MRRSHATALPYKSIWQVQEHSLQGFNIPASNLEE
jgi:hypothetical protein